MTKRLAAVMFSVAVCIAPVRVLTAQGTPVTLLDYHTTAPANWLVRPPSSSARLAQFVIPSSDTATNVEVVAYYFGASQGGGVEANLARWKSQFSSPDGSPVVERVTRDSSGAFPVTIAEYSGSYRRGIGAGSADSVRAGQTLIATIVTTPRGPLFIQLFGPSALAAAERARFLGFVRALK